MFNGGKLLGLLELFIEKPGVAWPPCGVILKIRR
jgi:hypothetical protein